MYEDLTALQALTWNRKNKLFYDQSNFKKLYVWYSIKLT